MDDSDLDALEAKSIPLNTKKATISRVKKFESWCERRSNDVPDYKNISADNFASILRKFYAEVSTYFMKIFDYSKTSLS